MDEFSLIREYFSQSPGAGVELGVGDDAALLEVPAGARVVATTDTLVEGRHFPVGTDAYSVGWKALAVNLSDLAAMGATPRYYLLALTLPAVDPAWLLAFARGLDAVAEAAGGVARVGGDTTAGALSITITALGTLAAGEAAMRRDGACPGDAIAVTGPLGDAALALDCLQQGRDCDPALRERLDRPQPRVAAGRSLRAQAHAAIDLSDGLAGDLGHILRASGVGAEIRVDDLPMSAAFARGASPDARLRLQAAGGDDYELCVCLPPAAVARLDLAPPLHVIGEVTREPGLRLRNAQGRLLAESLDGYRHF